MRIKTENYILNSDGLNYWITEEYETKSGKTDERMITGYCWTLEKCRQTFLERRISGNGATTLEELLEALKGVFEDTKELNEAKLEDDLDKLGEILK